MTSGLSLGLGPVDYLVIVSPGNRFSGDMPSHRLICCPRGSSTSSSSGRDSNGSVTSFEYDELAEGEPFAAIGH